MNNQQSNFLLYALLGASLMFAATALMHFVEPEGSNRNQVYLVIGVLLVFALMIIYDRSVRPH
ncbi:MAG: hypothetical protein ABI743_13710 [bacterium]